MERQQTNIDEITRVEITSHFDANLFNTMRVMNLSISGSSMIYMIVLFVVIRSSGTKTAVEVASHSSFVLYPLAPIFIFIAFCMYGVVAAFGNLFLNSSFLQNQIHLHNKGLADVPVSDWVRLVVHIERLFSLIRLSLLSAPPVFGLVTCYLAHSRGELSDYPFLWLMILVPTGIQLLFTASGYVLKDHYLDRMESLILPALKEANML